MKKKKENYKYISISAKAVVGVFSERSAVLYTVRIRTVSHDAMH